jgi:hypothetical protein
MKTINAKNTDKVQVVNNEAAKLQRYEAAKLKKEASKEATKETSKEAEIIVPEKTTGKQLSKLITTKIESNNKNKAELGTLSFNLAQFKRHAANFVKELNKKNDTKITIEEIVNIKPSQFTTFLTDKEKERLTKNGNLFTFWLVESLVSRYFNSLKK